MKTYKTGETVTQGFYFSLKALDLRFISGDRETLESKKVTTYVKIPSLLIIAAAPAIGGLFAMAFPAMVLIMAFAAFAKMIANAVSSVVNSRAHLVQMQWEPNAAYLKKNREKGKDAPAENKSSSELSALQDEVEKRRKDEQ